MRLRLTVIGTALVLPLLFPTSTVLARIATTQENVDRMNREKPDVLVVGNSMQGKGIDFPSLSKQVGAQVSSFAFGGAMSIWKYAVVKYVVPKLEKTPKVVVVVTRMNFITCPQRRAREYRSRSRGMAGDDPGWEMMHSLAIKGEGQPPWKREWNLEPLPLEGHYWDFKKAVKTSFLPYMVQAAKDGGFKLVIARHKSKKLAEDPNWGGQVAKKYTEELANYLEENGAIFLDYEPRRELKLEYYYKGDHLDEAGRAVWTRLMAEDLKAILAGKRAPNQRSGTAGGKTKHDVKSAGTQPVSQNPPSSESEQVRK